MFTDLLNDPTALLLFLGATGSLLSAAKLGSFSLNGLGVLLVGLLLGHFGFILPSVLLNFGLALFVYAVGLQAGPGFFGAFKSDGLKLGAVAIATTLVTSGVIVGVSLALGLSDEITLGAVCGAFNSALALASISEMSEASNMAVGFGVTFPLTLVLMTLWIRHLPDMLRKKPKEANEEHVQKLARDHPQPETRHFRISNPACDGRTVGDLRLGKVTGAVIAGIETKEGFQSPGCGQELHIGDLVKAVGPPEALEMCRITFGEETKKPIKKHRRVSVRRILVSNKKVVGKTLAQLAIQQTYGATVTRIRRAGLTLTPGPNTTLRYGDRLVVTVRRDRAKELIKLLGNDLQTFYQVRLLPAFLAMSLGAVVGFTPVSLPGGLTLRLGIAGGILIIALVVGRLGRVGPLLFSMPSESLQVLRKVGALMFMAALGTQSGDGLAETFTLRGPLMLIPGVVGILVGLVLTMLVSKKILKHDLIETVGCTSGSVANTVALESANSVLGNDYASSTYAVVYPVAIVAQILVAQIWFRLL